jgi:Zn-dependent protease with chaperone function
LTYCVNCGQKVGETASCCGNCGYDPVLPEIIIDDRLDAYGKAQSSTRGLDFAYPNERLNLIISIMAAIFLTAAFSVVTFLIFIPMLVMIFINFKTKQYEARRQMAQLSSTNYPTLIHLVKLACIRLRMPIMPAFIKNDASLNAYTMGFGNDGWIVVHSSLLNLLSP